MFTDRVFITDSILTECSQAGKCRSKCSPGRARSWSQNFVHEHKPAMIPRDVEILYENKRLVLEQQVQSSAIVSNFVAGSIQSQASKESALSKTIWWRFFLLQVQPRLLHRSFSAGQSVHNCIFNINYCSNWTRGKRARTAKRRLNFVHGGLHISRNAMLLWSCSRKVVRFSVTLSTTRILLLSFTELYFPLKCTYSSGAYAFDWSEIWIERRGNFGSKLKNFDMIDIWQAGRSCVLRKIFEG